jgi:hypothetical protein
MNVGFSGTQSGMTPAQTLAVKGLLEGMLSVGPVTVHHGACIGADRQVHNLCVDLGIGLEVYPSDSGIKVARECLATPGVVVHPPKAPLLRNHDIVDASEVLVAAPKSGREARRSGTWATVRYTRKQAKRTILVLPSGAIEQ